MSEILAQKGHVPWLYIHHMNVRTGYAVTGKYVAPRFVKFLDIGLDYRYSVWATFDGTTFDEVCSLTNWLTHPEALAGAPLEEAQ